MRIIKKAGVLALTFFLCLGTAQAAYCASVTEDLSEKIADDSEKTETEEVLEDWMTPIPASDLNDGSYEIEVKSSSHMFPIVSCTMDVVNGFMAATMTLNGDGYLYVYPGTDLEAAKAEEKDWIPYQENEEGKQTYTIPVKALDDVVKCAAYSRKKGKWYDRSLVFLSTSLPEEAFKEQQGTPLEDLSLEEGEYTIDALLEGGSGRASIESPAPLTVKDGKALLTVTFSSKNYDYMLVDGIRYDSLNTEGNSTFQIPITVLDIHMPVIADTTAMSKPHEIDYTIYLDSSSLTS